MNIVNTTSITKSRREVILEERRIINSQKDLRRDPLLFIYYVDDEVVSIIGDHAMFSEVEGFVSFNDFTDFLSPDICEMLAKELNLNMKDVDYESLIDYHKVYIVERYLNRVGKEASPGFRTRGTVLLLRQLG